MRALEVSQATLPGVHVEENHEAHSREVAFEVTNHKEIEDASQGGHDEDAATVGDPKVTAQEVGRGREPQPGQRSQAQDSKSLTTRRSRRFQVLPLDVSGRQWTSSKARVASIGIAIC